ncbi:DUF6056 family protein [Clostridium felsineum]|uniref:DUF6056 family protein n=1 Tax=Clostridium felsineum TaxID=36839 RepID=UPI00098CE49F|nr:DUF6056 family protein [Clostridium felsineum]URZ15133.1 hypothetical protein CLFE_011510 [Clostridium felsineum DSM 794]
MHKLLKKNKFMFIVATLILILIALQNWLGFISFDDYGYATLTYNGDGVGHPYPHMGNVGTSYGIIQILKFLKWHYLNWGGRVVGFFVLIVLLKFNPIVIKIFQTVLMFVYFLLCSKVCDFGKEINRVYNLVFAVAFFWLASLVIFAQGTMWYSAAVCYLWTSILIAFIMMRLFNDKKEYGRFKYLMPLVFFIGGWTHELVGLMFCVSVFVYIFFDTIFNKKMKIFNIICFIASLLGYTILIISPGSRNRMNDVSAISFYKLKFISRIVLRLKEEINIIFTPHLLPVCILIFLCLFYLSIYIIKIKDKKFERINKALPTVVIALTAFYIEIYYKPVVSLKIRAIFLIITAFVALYILIYHTLKTKNAAIIALAVGNVAAFLGALAAPYGGERTLLPFYIFVPLMFFYILKIQNMKINSLVLTVVVVVAFSNYLYIFRGYAKNFSTRNENSIVLKEDSKDIKKGEKINKIVLKKYDTSFSESEPWGLHSFQFLWMRNYYNIPQKVKIIYK